MFIVFPGQGSQKMHMGRPFAQNSLVMGHVRCASEITGKDVEYLIMEAESDELNRTENAQLAIFVLSYALFKLAESKLGVMHGNKIHGVAGHSLGEYTALAVAGVLSFEDACLLVKERSVLMQEVSGKMLAVLGVDFQKLQQIANLANESDEKCYVANHNSSTQIVLSGNAMAIERAKAIIDANGGRSVILPVSGPFHTPYMQDACDKLASFVDEVFFQSARRPGLGAVMRESHRLVQQKLVETSLCVSPDLSLRDDLYIPVFSNVTALPETDWAKAIKVHMCSPVLWASTLENMRAMHPGEEFIEIGAISLLTSMAKRDGYNMRYWQEYI